MSRESLVFLFGILIFFMPHLGIPLAWKSYFYSFAGIVLLVCGYSLRRKAYLQSLETKDGERSADSFVESTTRTE